MATYTNNHLLLTTNLKCVTGPWAGESAVWTRRFQVNRDSLDTGQHQLNTYDVHSSTKSRSLTLGATAGTVTQTWEGDELPETENVTDNDVDFFFTEAHAFFIAVRSFLPTDWGIESYRLYPVQENGKSPAGPASWVPSASINGSTSAPASPEIACCVSYYTATRSKSGRGRFYLGPLTQSIFSTTGVIVGTSLTTIVNAEKDFQNHVRARGTQGLSCTYNGIVWSRLSPTRGAVINKIRVGDEIDRQERRTKNRPEVYVNASVS